MAPPPPLPPLRPPLPSLALRRQQSSSREAADAVPPLRWRRPLVPETVPSETEATNVASGEAVRTPLEQLEDRASNKRKREPPRDRFVARLSAHESERVASPHLTDYYAERVAPKPTKKSPIVLQREEREDLTAQVRLLEAEIDTLLRRAGMPTSGDKAAVERVATQNYDMEEALHRGGRFLGRLDSTLTTELLLPTVNPISTFIHLPKDSSQRRDILRNMQHLKLRRGIEVVQSWLHHLDHSVPYLSEESFTTASGEYHYHRLQIAQFPNFRTARQLYDVYVAFLCNLEITITEEIGQLTLRENTDDFDPTIWHQRLLTVANEVGVTEELNYVDFAQFVDYSPHTNSPMGIIVRDTVNIDDLYPYEPDQRTCKDIQAVCMVYELRKPDTNETVVVLKDCAFAVQLVPQFPIDPVVLKQLHENTPKWPDAYIKYLREYVVQEDARH